MLNNIPQVTKNLLILNVLVFILTLILGSKGVDLNQLLSTHAIGSPLFQPYQVVTHMFAHAGFFHLLMNMWLFVMLGGYLERLWGPKRFFIFFLLCGFGAFLLQNAISVYQLLDLKAKIAASGIDVSTINYYITHSSGIPETLSEINNIGNINESQARLIIDYVMQSNSSMLGASGAVFGVLAAFAILFPNQEFMLYFAIPVKAKFLVGAYFIYEVYQAFQNNPNDQVAHLAHVGGAIVGAIIVLYWRKKDRANFY
ncbi:MAG: rhomboid family intramembrane serine protease [Crocinitomicaceae bacterium]|jgi:membrane associated rhomboid family serine protease|nr:rhomboid family intramembrane serine protease [Crocinitomicaceae bacterium]